MVSQGGIIDASSERKVPNVDSPSMKYQLSFVSPSLVSVSVTSVSGQPGSPSSFSLTIQVVSDVRMFPTSSSDRVDVEQSVPSQFVKQTHVPVMLLQVPCPSHRSPSTTGQ
jgi:hypothetical protein